MNLSNSVIHYKKEKKKRKERKKRLRDRKRWMVRTILPPMRKGLVKCDKGERKNEKGWEGKEKEVFE